MNVGLCIVEIHLSASHSLKEKRAVLLKVRDRLRGRFNVAIAELDHQDVWQRATLGIVSISDSQKYLDGLFQKVLAEIEKVLGEDVADHNIEYF